MKKQLPLVLIFLILFSCNQKSTPEKVFFLNKNAAEFPVWEELLRQEKVKLSDVVLAFDTYDAKHYVNKKIKNHLKKTIRILSRSADADGYYTSEIGDFKNLLEYRKALPRKNKEETSAPFNSSISSLSFETPNNSNHGQWKNIGPFGNPDVKWSATGNGAIQYLEMHPTNPAIMLACARNGGLWKTENYGKNWTPITDYFPTNNTSCVEICPANPNILYLGAAQDGIIWHSTDNGTSWTDKSTGISGTIYDIHSDPQNAARAIATTSSGIYLTTNSGDSWTIKITGVFTDIDITDNWDLIIASRDNDNTTPVLFFSKDKGTTFIEKEIVTHLTKVDRFYLGLHKPTTGATQVFAYGILNSNSPTRFIGLWKSNFTPNPADATSYFNFTEVKHATYTYPNGAVPLKYADNADGYTPEASDYYGSINPYSIATWISDFYVSPNNPDRLLTLREKFWGSEDGGIIWGQKPSYGGATWADNRFVTTNKAKDTVYWCNDGGMWAIKENDLFPTTAEVTASGLSKGAYINSKVITKNGDICVTEGTQMDISQLNDGVFITGGQDIGQVFVRNGRDTHVASADVYRGRIKPNDDTKFITGALKVKLDGGSDVFEVYNSIEPDHFNPDRLYGFTTKNATQNTADVRLVRSPTGKDAWKVDNFKGENSANSGGHSWNATHDDWVTIPTSSTGITTLKPGTFEQSKANKEIGFLGDQTGQKLFITQNLSSASPTWTQLSNAPASNKYRISTHANDENLIALATSNAVYISKDKGATWIIKGSFPGTNPSQILIDKNTSEGIYVMTPLTIYYIDENLTQWVEFNKGLPLHNHEDMRMAHYPNNDSRLFVTKYGRGVWSSPLLSVLNDNENKPIVKFSIHGTSSDEILLGNKVKLLDKSLNYASLVWTLENGSEVITISNEKEPEVILNTQGYYKVTLAATNANGITSLEKKQYIFVNAPPTELTCPLTASSNLDWYKGMNTIKVNTDTYDVTTTKNYIDSETTFEIYSNNAATFYIDDNYNGYNFYYKIYIDYNNDGDFDDANEEIASSGGNVETFQGTFTAPANAIINQPLRMRIASLEVNGASQPAPTNCQSDGTGQTVDFIIKIKNKLDFSTLSATVLSVNSASLQMSYANAINVNQTGFIYSELDGDLTLDNSEYVASTTVLGNTDSLTLTIADLGDETTYYYRPYVKDQNGISYGTTQSFSIETSTLACPLTSTSSHPYYKGMNNIKINNNNYDVTTTENYINSGTTFQVFSDEVTSFYIDDNYTPGYNFYYKIYIDYNNDGDFDDINEEIASSDGNVETFQGTFTVPTNTITSLPLRMRVASLEIYGSSQPAPTSCQNDGTGQTVDFLIKINKKINFSAITATTLPVNSASLQMSYTNAINANETGFVYSETNQDLTLENSDSVASTTVLGTTDSLTLTVANLSAETTYYYRPYVKDESGTSYGDLQSFSIETATVTCPLTSTSSHPWYKGMNNIKINNSNYDVTTTENYINSGTTFGISSNNVSSFYIDDNYSPGYNFYYKIYIDYNNDGDFDDANEEIASSGGNVETFQGTFTVPTNTFTNLPLRMRVASLEIYGSSLPTPSSCQNNGTGQTVDFLVKINTGTAAKSTKTKEETNEIVNEVKVLESQQPTLFPTLIKTDAPLTVKLPEEWMHSTMVVINNLGHRMKEISLRKNTNKITLDLIPGSYHVIIANDKNKCTKKIIIIE